MPAIYPCKFCRRDIGWNAPSGVCSQTCLMRAQGFPVEAEAVDALPMAESDLRKRLAEIERAKGEQPGRVGACGRCYQDRAQFAETATGIGFCSKCWDSMS